MEDPSLGPFDPGQVQIHDFNTGDLNEPGLPDWFGLGGVFWTGFVGDHQVRLRPNKGKAALRLRRYRLDDYFTAPNAIARNADGTPEIATVPARARVDVGWTAVGDRIELDEESTPNSGAFAGTYSPADVTVRWAARSAGYRIDVDSTSDRDVNISHSFLTLTRNGAFLKH